MKSLHDIFEKLGIEKVTAISNLYDNGHANQVALQEATAVLFAAYSIEMDVDLKNIVFTSDEIDHLMQKLIISASLYINVVEGFLSLKGHIFLTDDTASFTVTRTGMNHVENLLKS